jgi:cytidylate kinase
MPSQVIAISLTKGAGGGSVGRMVSERVGFRYFDKDLIARAAARGGIDPALIAEAERPQSLRARMLRLLERAEAGQAGVVGLAPGELMTSEELCALVREALSEVADLGEVVIVSDSAPIALAGRDDVLRVLITASPEIRARRLAAAEALADREAAKLVEDADLARARYLRRFYGIERELPSHYDLVLSTDVLGPGRPAELILNAAGLTARPQGSTSRL